MDAKTRTMAPKLPERFMLRFATPPVDAGSSVILRICEIEDCDLVCLSWCKDESVTEGVGGLNSDSANNDPTFGRLLLEPLSGPNDRELSTLSDDGELAKVGAVDTGAGGVEGSGIVLPGCGDGDASVGTAKRISASRMSF